MRDYDENIRLYTPVLQRIIILIAVVIAVPVMMWTITTFIRTYVGPPKIPTFQRMAASEALDNASQAAPADSSSTVQPATPAARFADAGATASDARTALLEIKRPQPAADQSAPAAPVVATSQPAVAAPATASSSVVPPAAVAPPSAVQASADTADKAGAAAPSTPSFAWPDPHGPLAGSTDAAGSPPAGTAAAPDAAASNDSATADLPAAEPLAGPIPIPRRRPTVFAMAQSTIPLPRARPAAAPDAAATASDTPYSAYDPSVLH
jgi:hypothetical protein